MNLSKSTRFIIALALALLAAAGCFKGAIGVTSGDTIAPGDSFTGGDPVRHGDSGATVRVTPTRIDDVLINPGMGFTDFHFGWLCNLPPVTFTPEVCAQRALDNWPANYPDSATTYFRWHWAQIEPTRDQIDFTMIDAANLTANLLGEAFSFRVMMVDEGGTPTKST